jgi:phosphoribosylaminoimidazole carboxylase PurE protein
MVLIVLGSDSDLPKIEAATQRLEKLGVPYELTICSAHRTPERAAELARTARERGVQVIIAGAGAAAHLPGVLAAYTTLPVIGVPLSGSQLQGVDALYSVVQMPAGVPVATVGIDGSANAALLACEVLALADEGLRERLEAEREEMAAAVEAKAERHGRKFEGGEG